MFDCMSGYSVPMLVATVAPVGLTVGPVAVRSLVVGSLAVAMAAEVDLAVEPLTCITRFPSDWLLLLHSW
jgi:hypothetical protein